MVRKILLSLIAVLGLCVYGFAQNRQVSGKVADAEGRPVAGATVMVDGTSTGTTTGTDGKFTIAAPADATLAVSFIGYETRKVAVAGKTHVEVVMHEDAQAIENVVVTAFGTTTKKDLTGSIATIRGEELAKRQVSTVSKMLEGAVPGVQLTTATNQPGTDAAIYVRGVGSLNAGTGALIVLDGSPYQGSLSDINPADIESISVSKDATANSLYGSRAANGVVFITTKRGSLDNPTISVDTRFGINTRAVPEYDIITDPGEYLEAQWRTMRDTKWASSPEEGGGDLAAAALYASQEVLGAHGNYNPYKYSSTYLIDPATGKLDPSARRMYSERLQDELFKTGFRNETNVSVSGGNEKSDYFISLGYLKDESYVIESDFERYSARVNVNTKLRTWIKVGANLSYAHTVQNNILEGSSLASSAFATARSWEPVYPVYARDAEGKIKYDENGDKVYDLGTGQTDGTTTRPGTSGQNIIATLKMDTRDIKRNNLQGRAYGEIYFLRDFTFTSSMSLGYRASDELLFYNPTIGAGRGSKGRINKKSTDVYDLNLIQMLNYKKSVGRHNINALIGHEYNSWVRDYAEVEKTNIYDPKNPQLNNAGEMGSINGYQDVLRIQGFFGKLEYNYDNRYYFSGGIRRDGTSRFKYNPWGTFWSVGASWRIGAEKFMESTHSWLSELKLRATYGTQGNEDLANYYPYTDQYTVTISEGKLGTEIYYYGNPDLTWEKQKTFDLGLDVGLLNDRINLTMDYFIRVSDGLLFKRTKDISTGRAYDWYNVGKLRNSGFEFDLNVKLIQKKDWYWDMSVNGYTYANKMLNLPDEYKVSGMPNGNQRIYEGKDIYRWEMRQFAGLDEKGNSLWYMDRDLTDGEGNVVGVEKVTTGDATEATQYLLEKSALPDFTGGLNTTLRWKSLDLTIMTNFQFGGYGYDYDFSAFSSANFPMNRLKNYADAWNPETGKGSAPIWNTNDSNINASSDRFLISKTYFNLRNITLGYTFPANWMSKIGIKSVRVYFACDNVFFASKRKGYDPRTSMGGQGATVALNSVDGTYYSPIRTTSVGLNINF